MTHICGAFCFERPGDVDDIISSRRSGGFSCEHVDVSPAPVMGHRTPKSAVEPPSLQEECAPDTFSVVIAHSLRLGIDVNHRDRRTLLITKVHAGGSVSRHNARRRDLQSYLRPHLCHEEEIAPGDRILEVNGVRSDVGRMMSAMKLDTELTLCIARAEETVVEVSAAQRGQVLIEQGVAGFIGTSVADSVSLEVVTVDDGESLCMEPRRLRSTDRIVALNGVRGCSAKLNQEWLDIQLPAKVTIRRVGETSSLCVSDRVAR